jgi:peptide deformylase
VAFSFCILEDGLMAVLKIVEWPAKVLETPASEVKEFNEDLLVFVNDMHQTMRESSGIGLAANQVGDLRRVITIEIPHVGKEGGDNEQPMWWHNKRFTFVNPVITKKSGATRWQEGCLSFPEVFDFVERASEVWVSAKDENGKEFEVHADGLFSICLQHEIDHIDGIVFFKRMSRLKADRIKTKMLKRGNINVEV